MRKKVFLSVLILLFFVVNFVSADCDNSNYTQGSNWIINSTNSPVICQDMTITLNDNLNVGNTGNLTFDNVTLIVNRSTDGSDNLFFEGAIYIYNSNFSALNQNYQVVFNDGVVFVNNSSFSGAGDVSGKNFIEVNRYVDNLSLTNSHFGYGNVYHAFWMDARIPSSSRDNFFENDTFDGSNYGFYTTLGADYDNPIQFKNCSFDKVRLSAATYTSFVCLNCHFGGTSFLNSFLFGGSVAVYAKNYNGTNQTYVYGDFNYSSNLFSDFFEEDNQTIIFADSSSTITIPSGINVTYSNVSISAGATFSNSNSFTVAGGLILNDTNFTLLDIALTGAENIFTKGVQFFHKLYLDVRAYYDSTAYSNVNLTGYDQFGNTLFSELSNSTGYIPRQNITTQIVNGSGLTTFTPITINSSEIAGSNRSRTINLSGSSSINVPQDLCEYPVSGDWTINDGDKICENRVITLTGDINITSGYNLTLINSTLNLSSSTSNNAYIYVGNNASFFMNYSKLYGKDSYAYRVHIAGSYDSNIIYINSFMDRYTNNSLYISDGNLLIRNSTFLREPDHIDGTSSNIDTYDCGVNFFTNDTTSKSFIMNRSVIYGQVCFFSDVAGGQINLTSLDSDVYDFSFTSSNLSQVYINNTLDLKVLNDSLENSSSTDVNITDENGSLIYSGTTDSNGNIYGVSLIHRIINSTSDVTKNYTVSSNGKTFGLEMGMPRREYNGRSVVVGTYNQDYGEKLAKVPYLYDFGFSLHDDADTFTYVNGNATYEGIYDFGFLSSVSQWWERSGDNLGFAEDPDELAWMLDLKNKGFELAMHSATDLPDYRNQTILAFNNWSELFGFPMMYIEHSSNEEHIISGSGADPTSDYYLLDLVNNSNVSYYWNLELYTGNAKWRTSPENSTTFYNGWKAYESSIDPITGDRWSYGEISLFPNYTNEKAKLPLVDEHGTSINLTSMIGKIHIRDASHLTATGLRQLYTPSHIYDLSETKELTITYMHTSAFGDVNKTLREIARYDGYFVPTGVLLDYSTKLEKVSITPGDKSFTVTNNGDSTIEGVVVYPDTNGTIINITYANITDGRYLLSVGIDKDEMMLPPLSSGESVTVNYDIMGAYDSTVPKVSNVSNGHVELRNAIYNSTAKKTEFGVGLDRITSYNSTNSTPRSTNITIENLDSSKTYTISRDGESWSNYSWSNNTLTIWTFMSTHNFTIQEKSADGASCTYADSCSGGYCNSGVCSSSAPSTSSTTTSSGGSSGGTYKPSSNNFQNGYKINVVKSVKIDIPFNNKIETVNVESVDESLNKVVVSVNGQNYEIGLNGNIKIDLDNDGFYDLEISNSNIYKEIATLEFNLISEPVSSDVQEEVGGENIVDSGTENKISFWKKVGDFFSRIWDWVKSYDNSLIIASVAVLVIAVGTGSYFLIRYFRKKGIARFRV